MNKFKVGDKVIRLQSGGRNTNHLYTTEIGDIITIKNIEGTFFKAEETANLEHSIYYYELAPNETNELYLQDLIKKANEGSLAEQELRKIAVDKLQWKNSLKKDWIQATESTFSGIYEYRLKPKSRIFTCQAWEVTITNDTIKIGCKSENLEFFMKQLNGLVKGNASNRTFAGSIMSATKKGIEYNGNLLTWENADQLLKELENE